jgi:hypothetical protein
VGAAKLEVKAKKETALEIRSGYSDTQTEKNLIQSIFTAHL